MKEKVLFSVFLSLLMLLAISPRVSVEAATHTEALLYAGQHTVVGEVVVWNDGENLYVKYTITEPEWYLVETHLEVATNLGDIPQTRNGNPIPGHFTYKNESHTFGTTEYTYVIPLENWEKGDELYIAAHAEVVKVDEVTTGNLVYNGDFEIPDIPYGEWNIFDSSVVGWGIEWYDGSETYNGYTRPETPLLEIHDHALGFDAYSGDQYAELDTDWDGPHGSLNGEPASVKIY
jgi:hypothetical protein